ncbi:HAD hydrolase-like protein [candidate division KSB1 bacterium]|nr:HAD hydrolase-like protein [candidate division KSB1 bacterium]
MEFKKIPGTNIEICEDLPANCHIKHALFDFDGTISMLRDGWQDVMVPMMVDELMEAPVEKENITKLEARGISKAEAVKQVQKGVEEVVIDFVELLTGKETVFQMMQLAEELQKRGTPPLTPLEYKKEYYRRLDPIVDARKARLTRGEMTQEETRVPLSINFLHELQQRDVKLYLASGTDEEYVKKEAETIGTAHLFTGGIWGARDDYKSFNKAKAIKMIIEKNNLKPNEILVTGDGIVEIENAREFGGIAIGVYTNEGNQYNMNKRKRERLINAGSHIIMPDFTHYRELVNYLFNNVK